MDKKIRALFDKERQMKYPRNPDHEVAFLARLHRELPEKERNPFSILKIAATIILIVSMGIAYHTTIGTQDRTPSEDRNTVSLGEISPELKQVEDQYLFQIKNLLTNIEGQAKDMEQKERYLNRLSRLQAEQDTILHEIKEDGPSTITIYTLIKNLRLQLELLEELEHEITSSKKSENYETI